MNRISCGFFIVLVSLLDSNLGFVLTPLSRQRLSPLHADTEAVVQVVSDANNARKELWKKVSTLEKRAIDLLTLGDEVSVDEAFKSLAESVSLKKEDPFLQLAASYGVALEKKDTEECERILTAMKVAGVPPHIAGLAVEKVVAIAASDVEDDAPEDVDPGSTFSDTVTEKIRVKVSSFYDSEKSDPAAGKYMFWYKVGIYNEGPEPVQVVARMWDIEKCRGDKETVRGSGIMSTQPIIAPGDVFTYQSVCPLKVFPPKGKRMLGSMSGAYTMCKGNMGQHNFSAKVGKFNLILPENVGEKVPSGNSPQ